MSGSLQFDEITGSEVAIIGMAGRFPGASDLATFWQNLAQGVESIAFFSDAEIDPAAADPELLRRPDYVKARGVLTDIEYFAAAFFGFSPREAQIRDPQHRIFLECAWEALEDAGYDSTAYPGAIGVYAGVSPNTYLLSNLLLNPQLVELVGPLHLNISSDKDFLTTLLSYKLNLRGPSMAIQTACSTSLVAVCIAIQGLLSYQCDMALAGGVSIKVPHKTGYLYQEGGILSPDGHCRAFDAAAQGSIDGNGAGVVLLKRLADAQADGDQIYAIIKGSAINNDGGLKVNYTAPSVDGQAEVIAMAQAVAGVTADSISYIETHGAGTVLGDPIEVAALTQAFRGSTEARGFCAIGSVKTNIGHLDAAAGIAGLIKTVLALNHRQIPPSLHFVRPNPQIDFANSPFYVSTKLSNWKTDRLPRRAGVSSFGVGGTNAHVVLEEAPPLPPSDPGQPWQLLLLSAKTPSALEQASDRLIAHLEQHPDQPLADVAYTLQVGRQAFAHRRALVCRDLPDALAALQQRDPERLLASVQETRDHPIAFMFPGLGEHYVTMALGLYQHEPLFREQLDYCATVLQSHLGEDIRSVLYPQGTQASSNSGSATPSAGIDLRRMFEANGQADAATQRLNQTVLAQPTVFAIEYALAQLWMSWGVQPQAVIGHSLGEYVAACLAGVFSLEDALRLVAQRARWIQALPTGGMISVLLPEEKLVPLLNPALSLAAVNGPAVCVVAGPPAALEDFSRELKALGIAQQRLASTHAFHSTMMQPVAEPLTRLCRTIKLNPPQIPYISNVSGTWISTAQATDPEYWARHLCQPVRFAAGVRELLKDPDRILLEVGPGFALSGLAMQQLRRDEARVTLPTLRQPRDQRHDIAFTLSTLGKLWLAGVPINWPALYSNERRQRVALPTYPFERQRYWIEPPPRTNGDYRQTTHLAATMAGDSLGPMEPISSPAEPTADRGSLRTTYLAPRSELEQSITDLWQQLLGVEAVGIHDNFFELGGHSLLVPQLISRLRDSCAVDLPVSSLFDAPTVAGLAALIERIRLEGSAAMADSTAIDLHAEVQLDPAISAHGLAEASATPTAILLTGATGFLGAFVLRELLEQTNATIYCLVRAANAEEGKRRIQRNLESYQLQHEQLHRRIIAVPGDLARPGWGISERQFDTLASSIDVIYHCGAWVNFTYPYSALKAANVQGLQEAIRLACTIKRKPIHFVSSVAVFSPPAYAAQRVVREDNPLEHTAGLFSGYAETKWVAEKILGLARQRGVPVAIYRPSVIGGHSQSGIGNPKDLIWNVIKGCIQLGVVPDLEHVPDLDTLVNIAPVDFVSKAIVHLAQQPESFNRAFHFSNPQPMHWSKVAEVIRAFGYPLRQVSAAEWEQILASDVANTPSNALFPFMPLFTAAREQATDAEGQALHAKDLEFDCTNTWQGLAGSAISCPPVDERLLHTYFNQFVASGFFEEPPAGEHAFPAGSDQTVHQLIEQ